MGGELLNVDAQGSGLAAEALGTDAEGIDLVQDLLLQLSIVGIGVTLLGAAHQSLLGEVCSLVEGAADAHTHDDGRTGIGTCFLNNLGDEVDDTFHTVGGTEHLDLAHVLGAEALGGNHDLQLVAGDDVVVDHGGGVVAGVDTVQRIAHHALAQIAFAVALADTFVDGILNIAVDMDFLTDLQEHAGNAGILADGHIFIVGDVVVFDDPLQNLPGGGPGFCGMAALDAVLHILGQVAVCFDAQPLDHFRDPACGNLTHDKLPPYFTGTL